jgi:hypothetical protein
VLCARAGVAMARARMMGSIFMLDRIGRPWRRARRPPEIGPLDYLWVIWRWVIWTAVSGHVYFLLAVIMA